MASLEEYQHGPNVEGYQGYQGYQGYKGYKGYKGDAYVAKPGKDSIETQTVCMSLHSGPKCRLVPVQ
jgi:hypothetical protein